MKHRTPLPFALGILLAMAHPATAQSAPSPCSYQDCALRATAPGLFSQGKVLRGAAGAKVTSASPSKELRAVFAVDDSASFHYARFESAYRNANILKWSGVVLSVAGMFALGDAGWSLKGNHIAWGTVLGIAGAGMGMASTVHQARAFTELSHAIWWHNRDFTGRASTSP